MVKGNQETGTEPAVFVDLSCEEVWRELSEMIDDALSPELRARVEAHLRTCAHCRAIYDGTRNVVRLLSEGEWIELPAGFGDRLLGRLDMEMNTPGATH